MVKLNTVVVAASLASASAFVPSTNNARMNTELMAEKKSIFSIITEMDLFAPVKDQNDYGARTKKNLSLGKLGGNSYVPAGLSKAEYEKIRANDKAAKDANYAKNVAKAGKFTDYTAWYKKRGTDVNDSWIKSATRGHDMAKTKYDWSGSNDAPGYTGVEKK